MTLDEQLRAALNQEADMVQAPAPDVDRLISGGTVRRRRRTATRLGVAAAVVAVLVGGGVYAATQLESDSAVEPAQPPSTPTPSVYRDTDGGLMDPDSTYRMLVAIDDGGVAMNADLSFDGIGWHSYNFPVLSAKGGVAVFQPLALAAGTGCVSEEPNREVAETAPVIAQQLAQLPRSTVEQAPTPVQAFGHDAVHLRVRIDKDCGAEGYRLAETVRGSHGISYGFGSNEAVVDFWVVDVDGVPVVVDAWHDGDTPDELVDQIARAAESVTFVAD